MKLVAAVLMLLTMGALGEVVEDFNKHCSESFVDSQPPVFTINSKALISPSSSRYKQICQRYKNQYHYATLYDTAEKIPVYSAYQYQRTADCKVDRPKITWMIEPQLENVGDKKEMDLQGSRKIINQAYNSDYDGSRYDRGHLYPHCHTPSDIASNSTFTLTNAAPQRCDFNKFWYSKVEDKVRQVLNGCVANKQKKAYVVTGVVPSSGKEYLTLKNTKVNVPTHFWSAYCCCDSDVKCTFGGYIMHKEDDEPTLYQQEGFNDKLKILYNMTFKVFDKSCVPVKKPRVEKASG